MSHWVEAENLGDINIYIKQIHEVQRRAAGPYSLQKCFHAFRTVAHLSDVITSIWQHSVVLYLSNTANLRAISQPRPLRELQQCISLTHRIPGHLNFSLRKIFITNEICSNYCLSWLQKWTINNNKISCYKHFLLSAKYLALLNDDMFNIKKTTFTLWTFLH